MTITDIPTGEKCEFKVYCHSTTKKGEPTITTVPSPFTLVESQKEDDIYALVVTRILSEKNQLEKTTLQVNSKRLVKVFNDLIHLYPAVPADFTEPFELQSPFQILLHYWTELEQRRDSTRDAEERMHLNLLLSFMKHEIGPDRDQLLSMLRKAQITFYKLWCIFRPGDLVYTEFMGHPWLMKCQKTAYEEDAQSGPYIEIHCVYTDHNGKLQGEVERVIRIYQKENFAAENPANITDLPCYPRKFLKNWKSLEEELSFRGRKFLHFQGVNVMSYSGEAQYLKEPPYSYYSPMASHHDGIWLPFTETGRIILDRQTFQEDKRSNAVTVQANSDPDPLLCPPYEVGYSLTLKEWCRFFIDQIEGPKWRENAWETLIIGDEEKTVLQSLVTSHSYPRDSRDQSMQKGKGLVILLHGSPGSGKTLTAETAAEGTKRVLISASLGEFNKSDSPWAFERSLKSLLQYATAWKGVVLMDEADVFLEAREDGVNSSRNAIVAVFLKELEYFGGIVFLTTNRIKSFDKAMKSRLHLALEYTPPGRETRRRLWIQILKAIPDHETQININDTLELFLSVEMNGREIANAVHTARTISRFQKRPLENEHIRMVVNTWSRFNESLKIEDNVQTNGVNEKLIPTVGQGNSILKGDGQGFQS